MKITLDTFIKEINEYARQGKYFWVCAIAKDCTKIFANRLDELTPLARQAVEHYLLEQDK